MTRTRSKPLSLAAAAVIAATAPQALAQAQQIRVLRGGGIRPAMEELAARFEKANDCRVIATYAGSGTLFGSLQAGTEADVHVPGDIWYVHKARDKGMVASHKALAWFVPVIGVQKGNPEGINTRWTRLHPRPAAEATVCDM